MDAPWLSWRTLPFYLRQPSELPDIEDDHGRGIVLHLKKHRDGSNDAEANVLIPGFTEVAWGPRQPKIDLTHGADEVGPIFRPKNQ